MLDQFRAQKLEWNRANNQIYDRVETSSGDSNGRTLFVQISNGGTVEDLTGAALSLAWNKKTEQGLESFEEVDAKKGQYRLFYPTGMLVNHGVLQASLVLVDVTGRIESKPFDIIVHKGAVDDEAVESDNKFTALTMALVKVSQVQAEFDGLYADKSLMMDTLHDDKKADMEALEQDYANRANTLETTYAPRLTSAESEIDMARGGAQTLGERLDSEKAEVTAQLAQTEKQLKYPDLLEMVRNQSSTSERVFAQAIGDRSILVGIPINDKLAYYRFRKNGNDDHIKIDGAGIANKVLKKNYESTTGSINTNSAPLAFATTVGSTITFKFTGTGFDFNHHTDNRGGLWEFDIAGEKTTITTHINGVPSTERSGSYGVRPIARNLDYGEHTVTATFKGDDPNNPPAGGAGTSRGWVCWTSEKDGDYRTYTASIYGTDAIYNTSILTDFEVIQDKSNVEFALSVKPTGTAEEYHWFPEHSSVGTLFADEQKILFDGKEITDFSNTNKSYSAKSIIFYQKSKGYHPSDSINPLAEIMTVYSITNRGLSVNYKVNFLRDTDISSGYTMMLPANGNFMDKIILNDGVEALKIVGSSQETTSFNNSDEITSLLIANNSDSKKENYVLAYKFVDPLNTLRQGKEDRETPIFRIQHRTDGLQKFYPGIFKAATVNAGEEYTSKAEIFIGQMQKADAFI